MSKPARTAEQLLRDVLGATTTIEDAAPRYIPIKDITEPILLTYVNRVNGEVDPTTGKHIDFLIFKTYPEGETVKLMACYQLDEAQRSGIFTGNVIALQFKTSGKTTGGRQLNDMAIMVSPQPQS